MLQLIKKSAGLYEMKMEYRNHYRNVANLKSPMSSNTIFQKMRFVLFALSLLFPASNYAQVTETYTNNSLSGFNWQIEKELIVHSNSLQQLRVENNNKDAKLVTLPINWKGTSGFELSFHLSNTNSPTYNEYEIKNGKQTKNIITKSTVVMWGVCIKFYGANGSSLLNKIGFIGNRMKRGCVVDDEEMKFFEDSNGDLIRIFRYGNKVLIHCGDGYSVIHELRGRKIAEWSNIEGIEGIYITVGSQANIKVTDFNFIRKETRVIASPPPTNKIANSIKLQKKGGVYEVPVELNGVLKINFIFDSGASDVSISPDVALTLMRTGTIKESDWLPGAFYSFADGSTAKSERFKLRSVKIGNKTVYDVTCSIANSIEAPMLLGQSVLSKFGKYSFDYRTETLIIE